MKCVGGGEQRQSCGRLLSTAGGGGLYSNPARLRSSLKPVRFWLQRLPSYPTPRTTSLQTTSTATTTTTVVLTNTNQQGSVRNRRHGVLRRGFAEYRPTSPLGLCFSPPSMETTSGSQLPSQRGVRFSLVGTEPPWRRNETPRAPTAKTSFQTSLGMHVQNTPPGPFLLPHPSPAGW